jgi:SET domain-containing protein
MDNPKVKVRHTRKYGKGVFALAPIRKGEIVAVFDGPIYDEDFDDWTRDLQNHAIQIGRAKWRDSKGLARWINHSCEPNCGVKSLVKIVAMRRIEAGEQITWDYEMTEKSDWWRMRCRCGSSMCRKWIGNYANMPRGVRRKYAGYISAWLIRRK